MDSYEETRALVRQLRIDAIRLRADCERARQLIRESEQLLASISQLLEHHFGTTQSHTNQQAQP